MRRTKSLGVAAIILLFTLGCVQMRDYFGTKKGAFGLDVKKGFGEGKDKKDYYVIGEGEGLVIGDVKNEAIAKMGTPNKIETTLEGYECWIYEERSLKLFFDGDYLNGWSAL